MEWDRDSKALCSTRTSLYSQEWPKESHIAAILPRACHQCRFHGILPDLALTIERILSGLDDRIPSGNKQNKLGSRHTHKSPCAVASEPDGWSSIPYGLGTRRNLSLAYG